MIFKIWKYIEVNYITFWEIHKLGEDQTLKLILIHNIQHNHTKIRDKIKVNANNLSQWYSKLIFLKSTYNYLKTKIDYNII